MLSLWERFSCHLKLSQRLRAATVPRCRKDATYLHDLKLEPHPLTKDQAVQDAWDIQFRHYTTVSCVESRKVIPPACIIVSKSRAALLGQRQ
jgi:hypothetical protein